jgi:hypothetical protein
VILLDANLQIGDRMASVNNANMRIINPWSPNVPSKIKKKQEKHIGQPKILTLADADLMPMQFYPMPIFPLVTQWYW